MSKSTEEMVKDVAGCPLGHRPCPECLTAAIASARAEGFAAGEASGYERGVREQKERDAKIADRWAHSGSAAGEAIAVAIRAQKEPA